MLPPLTDPSATAQRHVAADNKFNLLNFARESLRKPASTGAVAPSSKYVAKRIIQHAQLSSAESVVELGPGSGVFTEQILAHINRNTTFFALELNKTFVEATRRRCPQARVYHDSAEYLPHYLRTNTDGRCDRVICSLPWTILDPVDQDRLLETISTALKPGGLFISIVYLGATTRVKGRYFIDSLPLHFSKIHKTQTVWQNLPPTQVYCCTL